MGTSVRMRYAGLGVVVALCLAGCGGSKPSFDYTAFRSCLTGKRVAILPGYTPRQMGVTAPVQHSFRIGFPFAPPPVATDAASVIVTRDHQTLDRFIHETMTSYQRAHPELPKATPASAERDGILILRSRVGVLWDAAHHGSRKIVTNCLDAAQA